MSKKIFSIILLIIFIGFILFKINKEVNNKIPLVAIANYGPHASLSLAISGFKSAMTKAGFIEGKTIRYQYADVNFSQHLISQMLLGLSTNNPKAMLVLTTPVAQSAKKHILTTPLIYSVITNPVESGLIPAKNKASSNMTGSSDSQNLEIFFKEVKRLLPKAKRVGVLYSTAESNDLALVQQMKKMVSHFNMQLLALPIDDARDISVRMELFKGKVDFLYVGASGPIQPSLPVIALKAKKLNIPVFNVESDAVHKGLALASIGVNYEKVGENSAQLMIKVLQGKNINALTPLNPRDKDMHRVINITLAKELGITIPKTFNGVHHD